MAASGHSCISLLLVRLTAGVLNGEPNNTVHTESRFNWNRKGKTDKPHCLVITF